MSICVHFNIIMPYLLLYFAGLVNKCIISQFSCELLNNDELQWLKVVNEKQVS